MRLPALVLTILALLVSPALAQRLDDTPRVAVISAFPPEIGALNAATNDQRTFDIQGVRFTTGRLEGKPVVVFLSGVSMVNAAMTTQMALDRFNITRIVFSGIAGGVDETLDIGDVVVADRWAQNLESAFARETGAGFDVSPSIRNSAIPNYGMIFPRSIILPSAGGEPETRAWFPADPILLKTAAQVASQVALQRCAADKCLIHPPKVVIGGAGVSAPVFLDNAAYRKYLRSAFEARLVDMESAAVAHVAYVNKAPFIAFRSLSDLAGGGAGANEMHTFMALASDNSATVVKAFVRALPN